MAYTYSRLMSAATASYAAYCFARPDHLGQALDVDRGEQEWFEQLALVFGVRDAAVSTFGVLGRSPRTVTTAMWIRIACGIGDGIVLASRTDDETTRAKILTTTLGWGTLNLLALAADKRRAAKRLVKEKAQEAKDGLKDTVKSKAAGAVTSLARD